MWITRAVVVASVVMFISVSESKSEFLPGVAELSDQDLLATFSGNKPAPNQPAPAPAPSQPAPEPAPSQPAPEPAPSQPAPEPAPSQPAPSQPAPEPNPPKAGCGSFYAVSKDPETSPYTDRSNSSPLIELGGTVSLHTSATDLRSSTHICGAALISDRYVLTAAHCVTGNGRGRVVSISIGRVDLNENPTPGPYIYEIESIIIHPGYESGTHEYNNIAILKTNRQVSFSDTVWPYCLPEKNQVFQGLVQIAGWGLVDETSKPSDLKSAFVRVINHPRCESKWLEHGPDVYDQIRKLTYPKGLTNEILCAGRDGVDACEGDDGGPMVYQNPEGLMIVIGIIAERIDCPDYPITPGFYANVAHYTEWIYSTTGLPRPGGGDGGDAAGDGVHDDSDYDIRGGGGGFLGVGGGGNRF